MERDHYFMLAQNRGSAYALGVAVDDVEKAQAELVELNREGDNAARMLKEYSNSFATERAAREQAEAQRDDLLNAIRSFREARAAWQRHESGSSYRLKEARTALLDKADSLAAGWRGGLAAE